MSNNQLCELHFHLFGCIRGLGLGRLLLSVGTLDWPSYEATYRDAFGDHSPVPEHI